MIMLGHVHRRRAVAILTTFAINSSSRARAFAPACLHVANPAARSAFPLQFNARGRQTGAQFVTLPDAGNDGGSVKHVSVTGTVYDAGYEGSPVVQLYTKYGCTLCDKVSDVLRSVRDTHPHTLEAVDITDDDKAGWYDKYKYDIPVLHMNGKYWAKHRLTAEVALEGLEAAKTGTFQEQVGQPDAGAMERQQDQRLGS